MKLHIVNRIGHILVSCLATVEIIVCIVISVQMLLHQRLLGTERIPQGNVLEVMCHDVIKCQSFVKTAIIVRLTALGLLLMANINVSVKLIQ